MFKLKVVHRLLIFLAAFILIVLIVVKFLMPYILPFVIAFLLAILIDPLVNFLEKKNIGRGFAVFISLFIFLLLLSLLLTVMFSQVYIQLDRLVRNLPEYEKIGENLQWIMNQDLQLTEMIEGWELPSAVSTAIDHNLESFYQTVLTGLSGLVDSLLDIIRALPNIFIITIIVFIATFFASRDRDMILDFIMIFVPHRLKEDVRGLLKEIASASFGFIRAMTILISITIMISIIGLEVLSSEYSLIVAFAAGILDLIPVIGPSLVYFPWALYSFFSGQIFFGIGLLVIYGVIIVVRQVAEARILGSSIGIHPLATLISIYIGIRLFGVGGFFLGPALLIILKAIFKAGLIPVFVDEE